jgi:hypothetical protein
LPGLVRLRVSAFGTSALAARASPGLVAAALTTAAAAQATPAAKQPFKHHTLQFTSRLMQSIHPINQATFKISLDRFVDRSDVGDQRLDAARLHTRVRARAHPAAQQHVAIADRFGHARMSILRGRIKTVALARLMIVLVRLVRKMRVTQLVTPLSIDDPPVLNRGNHIIRCAAKVLTDALFVFGNHGYFHHRSF